LFLQQLNQFCRQNGETVFAAFTVTNDDLPKTKIQVFDPQTQSFLQTQTRAIEQISEQPINAAQISDNYKLKTFRLPPRPSPSDFNIMKENKLANPM